MKRVITTLLAVVSLTAAFGQGKTTVAVYVQGNADGEMKEVIGSKFIAAIRNSDKYVAVDRTDEFLAVLGKERNFQSSGNVDDGQLIELGRHFDVKMVCAVDVSHNGDDYYIISSRMIDMEKGLAVSAAAQWDIPYSSWRSSSDNLITIANSTAARLLQNVTTIDGKKQIALYVTEGSNTYKAKCVSSALTSYLTSSGAAITVERTSDFLAALQKAKDLRQLGYVDDKQLNQLGRLAGVDMVCRIRITSSDYTTMRITDIKTAVIMATSERQETSNVREMSVELLQQLGYCTKKNQRANEFLKCCGGLVEKNGICRDKEEVERERKEAERKAEAARKAAEEKWIKTTATLNFTANIDGASIYVDEDYVGSTPYTKKGVPFGFKTVRFSKTGYKDYSTTIYASRPQSEPQDVRGKLKLIVDDPFVYFELRGSMTAPVGFSLGFCNRFGGYLSVKSDYAFLPIQKVGASFVKEADLSTLDYNDRRHNRLAVTGGFMMRPVRSWDFLYLYGGAGYGKYGKAYKVAETDNDYYCPDVHEGLEAELGAMFRWDWFNLSLGYSTNAIFASSPQRFSDVQVGLGFNLDPDDIAFKFYREPMFVEYRWLKTAPYGMFVGYCYDVGAYLGAKYDGKFTGKNLLKEANPHTVNFDDRKDKHFAATGGAMLRLAKWLYLYAGAGYGEYGEAYKVSTTDKDYYCPELKRGAELEAGAMLRLSYFNLSAGYNTLIADGKQQLSGLQLGGGFNFNGGIIDDDILRDVYNLDGGILFIENRWSKTAPIGVFVGGGGEVPAGPYVHLSWGDRSYATLGLLGGGGPLFAYGGIGFGTTKYSTVTKPVVDLRSTYFVLPIYWRAAFQYEYGVKLRLSWVSISAGRSHMKGFAEWHFGGGIAIPI